MLFIGTIGAFAYYTVQEVFYPNRVKVTILDRQTSKPITLHKVTLREVCDSDPNCQQIILVEGKTNLFGHISVSTKQLSESFEVIADGYKTDGPWRKRPGSLFFSRQYSDTDFYSTNIGQTDMEIKLEPAN